jgi:hypothetical protein
VHTFRNFKRSCITLYAKPWEHPSAVALQSISILLLVWVNSSTCCTASAQSQQGDLVGHHLQLWMSLREAVNHFMWQTLPTINKRHFFMNILCIESFCPGRNAQKTLLFSRTLLKHGRHFYYWNQALNMHMLPRLTWSWAVLLPSDVHRKPVTAVLLPFMTYLLTLPHSKSLLKSWNLSLSGTYSFPFLEVLLKFKCFGVVSFL